jgi:hypothetical protein
LEAETPRLSLAQIMIGNASLLSVIYLAAGVVIEALRRIHPSPWMERASLALDSLPARVLDLVGALGPLHDSYLSGRVSEISLRLIFGATVVGVIFAMAVALGALMWIARWLWARQVARGDARD